MFVLPGWTKIRRMDEAPLAALVALIASSALFPLVYFLLVRQRNFDHPSGRSSHDRPIPRGAGAAQIGGVASAWVSISFIPGPAVAAILMFGILGFVDDLRAQRAGIRFVLQLLFGLILAGLLIQPAQNLVGSIAAIIAGMLLAVLVVNASNFMDGVNGLSSLHGLLIGATYLFLLKGAGSSWVTMAGVTVAISLAFLPWNWGARARMFMGDSGSYLLGALFAGLLLASWKSGIQLWLALAPMTIYLVDVCVTLVRRLRARDHLFVPHRSHTYQQLCDLGLSHAKTSLTVGVFTMLSGVLTIATYWYLVTVPVSLVLFGLLATCYLLLPALLRVVHLNRPPNGTT